MTTPVQKYLKCEVNLKEIYLKIISEHKKLTIVGNDTVIINNNIQDLYIEIIKCIADHDDNLPRFKDAIYSYIWHYLFTLEEPHQSQNHSSATIAYNATYYMTESYPQNIFNWLYKEYKDERSISLNGTIFYKEALRSDNILIPTFALKTRDFADFGNHLLNQFQLLQFEYLNRSDYYQSSLISEIKDD